MKFEDTPLITPERVVIDPLATFAIAPGWVRLWAPVEDLEALQAAQREAFEEEADRPLRTEAKG